MGRAMASDVKTLDAALAEREQVLRMIRAHEAGLRALGVSRLWLFGSLARGEAGADSDVDIMIAIPRGRSSRCSIWARSGLSCASCSAGRSTS